MWLMAALLPTTLWGKGEVTYTRLQSFYSNAGMVAIDKVVLSDTATVMYCTAKGKINPWFQFAPSTYLSDEEDARYPVKGAVGLTLGECMRRGYKPFKLMLISSVACLISIGASFLIALYIMGIQPVDMMFTSLEEAARESVGYYQSMGMSQTEIDAAVKSNAEMLRMMRLIMPGAFFLCAPIIAFVNYLAARKILSKLGAAFEEFPPFTQWNVPGWMLWPYGISLLMVSYYVQYPESLMYHISVNLQVITSVFFVLQGIALIYWWLEKNNKPKWWGTVSVALLFFVQIFSQIIVFVGAFDLVFDFRNLSGKRTSKRA